MFIKDKFKSGEFIMVMPVGIPLTVQYSPKGILERAYIGIEEPDDLCEVSHSMFNMLYNSKKVPVKIPLTGGTTRVRGVLYTGTNYAASGNLPDCIMMDMTCDFTESPDKFNFFASIVTSTATNIKGGAATQRWFNMCQFNTLPSFLAPTPLTYESWDKAVSMNYPFIPNMVMYYVVHSNSGYRLVPTELTQFVVSKTQDYIDEFGNIKVSVYHSSGKVRLDYADVLKFNIQRGRCLVMRKSVPLRCFGNTRKDKVPSVISCKMCGKQIVAHSSGSVKCGDPHCLSNIYPDIKHFIHSFNLPEIGFEEYLEFVGLGKIKKLVDIFSLSAYSGYTLETNLSSLLRALIPVKLIPQDDVIKLFCQKCNGNVNMFNYYVQNPHAIQKDFHLTGKFVGHLVKWLSDNYNQTTITELIDSDYVTITDGGMKFQGSPIFRNKRILITGQFTHGSHDDIKSILKSYSAEVVERFDSDIDCAIVGSTLEDVNSIELNKVKLLGLPIFDESEFFSKYEIDKDLNENLL